MEKAIIVLNGKNEGKTKFIETAKKNNFWIWNLNYKNVISMIAHKIGWDGDKNKQYYDFAEKFLELSKTSFNSEMWYISSMVEKFNKSEKPNLLIVHGCSNDVSKYLQENFNAYTINIATSDENVSENTKYCKVLNCNKDTFEQDINETVKIITKDFSN